MGFWVRSRISPFDLEGISWLDRLAYEKEEECKKLHIRWLNLNDEYKSCKAKADNFRAAADTIANLLEKGE